MVNIHHRTTPSLSKQVFCAAIEFCVLEKKLEPNIHKGISIIYMEIKKWTLRIEVFCSRCYRVILHFVHKLVNCLSHVLVGEQLYLLPGDLFLEEL